MDASLRTRTAVLLREFLPGIRGLLDETGGREIGLTEGQARRIQALLDDYERKTGPGLRAELEVLGKRLAQYERMTLREIWQLEID